MSLLTKRECAMLEKLFAAEVDGAMRGWDGIVQADNATLRKLGELGLAEQRTERVPGHPPMTITGWALTLAGNAAYCMLCACADDCDDCGTDAARAGGEG